MLVSLGPSRGVRRSVPALVKGRFVFQPHCNTGLYNMQPSGQINCSGTDEYNVSYPETSLRKELIIVLTARC